MKHFQRSAAPLFAVETIIFLLHTVKQGIFNLEYKKEITMITFYGVFKVNWVELCPSKPNVRKR
jgi:hypothetical protein